MKKFLVWFLVLFATFAVSFLVFKGLDSKTEEVSQKPPKEAVLRVALVADSEGENDLLEKALNQAQGAGVNFIVGLGDWSTVGTRQQLTAAKTVFDSVKIPYYLVAGDHDLWDSRNQSLTGDQGSVTRDQGFESTAGGALGNYVLVFGQPSQFFDTKGIRFILVDNSDIYKGISSDDWGMLDQALGNSKLTFVFAHKTPFHPDSSHVMGEGSAQVTAQAKKFMDLMEQKKVDGFFSGDLHFFAKFKSPSGSVRITTIGAVDNERNFQGPRFGLLTVYSDYSWDVEDVEIR